MNKNNSKIVWISCFWGYIDNWKNEIIVFSDCGERCFTCKMNLTKTKVIDFHLDTHE